jgi:hypothetical protein
MISLMRTDNYLAIQHFVSFQQLSKENEGWMRKYSLSKLSIQQYFGDSWEVAKSFILSNLQWMEFLPKMRSSLVFALQETIIY